MSDQPLPTSISINTGRDVNIGGSIVGRDQIIHGYTAEQVRVLLTQISTTFQQKPFDGRCPYRGLEAFGEDDAEYFFGRERLVTELVERVKQARCVVIAGPSGSGKSSLVRAGLIPALKNGVLPHSNRWRYEMLTPGRSLLDELARVASSLAASNVADRLKAWDEIRAKVMTDATLLHKSAEVALGDGRKRRALIVVDQFEETFTQVVREDERAAFLNLLTHAATVEAGRATVVFVLRSDFISNCATYPALNDLINTPSYFFQVGAMQPGELVSAIARPALQVGLRIDPDLIAQIINDMQDEPGALPLMQFALKDLFDAQQATGLIALTLEGYLARGGLHRALECHADAAFAQLNSKEQEIACDIFMKLIQLGRGTGTPDTRRTALLSGLSSTKTDRATVEAVVQKLADARLVMTDTQDGLRTITLVHDTLINAWPWLRQLVNENRKAIELQNEIDYDAQEWEQNSRDSSYLYTGARLATVREKLVAKQLALSELAQTFVNASREVEDAARRAEAVRQQAELEKERKNAARLAARNRIITGVGLLAIVLAIAAITFGLQSSTNAGQAQAANTRSAQSLSTAQAEAQSRATAEANALAQRDEAQRQAQLALSHHLAAQALAYAKDKFDLSVLLGIEALELADTLEARNSLLTSLYHHPRILGYLRGHEDTVFSVAFSPDGKVLASGSGDGTVYLWDIATRQPVGQLMSESGIGPAVTSVAFSPDGKLLASSSEDGTVHLWDLITHQTLGEPLIGPAARVTSLAFNPDGEILASGSGDRTVWLWDVKTHQPLGEPLIGHTGPVFSVAFSPNGKIIASGSLDKTVRLWDVTTHQTLGEPLSGHSEEVTSLAFNPDGEILASGSGDRTVWLWDVKTHQPLGEPLIGHTGPVFSVAFSPNGKIIASASWDSTVQLWNKESHQPLSEPLTGHTGAILSVAFSPDGKVFASASWDRTVLLWDMAERQRLGTFLNGHNDEVTSLAFSPDGQTLASGGCSYADGKCDEGDVQLWNMTSHELLGKPFTKYSEKVTSVAFSPDGTVLASGSADGTVQFWDMATGQLVAEPLGQHSGEVTSIAFSPDGKVLASGSADKTVRILDIATYRLWVDPLSGHSNRVTSLAFNPNGTVLASGSADGTVQLWDAETYQLLKEPLTKHSDQVTSVAFSPDGTVLASGSADGTVQLWDMATGQLLGEPLLGHSNQVTSLAFSPDGTVLVSGSTDGTMQLWDISVDSWKVKACNIIARNLNQDEWKQYMREEPYGKTCEDFPEGVLVSLSVAPETLSSPEEILLMLAAQSSTCSPWLIFHTFRDQNLEIYRLDGVEGVPGAQLFNLSNSTAVDSRPSRSPNDQWMVFESNRNGNVELYYGDMQGQSQVRLTNTNANNINAMVGPDNKTVIFQSDRNGNWDIFSIDITTGLERQLTTDSHDDVHPYWSPDPNWIVFESNRTGSPNLFLLNLSTGNEFQVTRDVVEDIFPAWSPNGEQLAFLSNVSGFWSLFVVDVTGKNLLQITHEGDAGNVSWSPEGNRLAYQVENNGNVDVYTYDLQTGKEYRLTDYAGPDSAPTWDCSGTRIAFTSTRDGDPNLLQVSWQGGPQTNLTINPATDKWAEWSPSKETGSRGH
jgi:WD40 repeat protein